MKSRFLCDGMLGRLCRALRLLGYDARLAGPGESPLLLVNAASEGRVAVTAARRRLDRRGPAPIVLHRPGCSAQIVELFATLRGTSGESPVIEPFTRCLECNVVLEAAPPAAVAADVPERILAGRENFVRCPACARVYWCGSHWEALRARVERIRRRLDAEGLL